MAVPVGVVVPAGRRNNLRRVVEMYAMGQRRLGLVQRRRGVGQRGRRSRCPHHDVFVGRAGDRRAVVIARDRELGRRVEGGVVESVQILPPAPHDGVAARHQERVGQHGRIRDRRARVVAVTARVDRDAPERRPGLAAAVRRLVHHFVRALGKIDRLQDVEVEGVLDVASGVSGRKLDVDDDSVLPVTRVDFTVRRADHLLVLTDLRPRVTAERRRLRPRGVNLDPRDARVGRRCREQ